MALVYRPGRHAASIPLLSTSGRADDMPQTFFCWRCNRDAPMLSEEEFAEVARHGSTYAAELQARKQATGLSVTEVFASGWLPSVLAEYKRLTGVHETNVNVVWHHRASLYGPRCRHCGVALRTPQASFCFRCHRAQDDLALARR
ncbi:MAG: hypothetical protein QM750_29060 [Rubrivivax sp.]